MRTGRYNVCRRSSFASSKIYVQRATCPMFAFRMWTQIPLLAFRFTLVFNFRGQYYFDILVKFRHKCEILYLKLAIILTHKNDHYQWTATRFNIYIRTKRGNLFIDVIHFHFVVIIIFLLTLEKYNLKDSQWLTIENAIPRHIFWTNKNESKLF